MIINKTSVGTIALINPSSFDPVSDEAHVMHKKDLTKFQKNDKRQSFTGKSYFDIRQRNGSLSIDKKIHRFISPLSRKFYLLGKLYDDPLVKI